MQPVGELVLLCPQRVGQPGDAVQFPQERLQFGAVPQGHDRADVPAREPNRHPVDHEQELVGEHDLIRAGVLAREHVP